LTARPPPAALTAITFASLALITVPPPALLALLLGELDGRLPAGSDASGEAVPDDSGEIVTGADGLGVSSFAIAVPASPSTATAPAASTIPVRVRLFILDLLLDPTRSRSSEIRYRHAAETLRPG
jgi:hypothetical protein